MNLPVTSTDLELVWFLVSSGRFLTCDFSEARIGNDDFGIGSDSRVLEIEYLVAETFTEDADDWHIKDVKEF